ncbi:MAG: response regulator transcription factor, partial [Solirubrobacteraceae bacterium]
GQVRLNGHENVRPIRLLIADHAPTRLGIRMALGPGVSVSAEADSVEQAIRAAKREQPDVALIGCEISADWRGAVRGVCRAAPDCAVVVLAQSGDADDMLESVRAGAVGYVPGALDADRLRRVFRAVAENEAVVPRAMVIELLSELRGGMASGAVLTGRETQVLGMLRRGHSTAWIAERLQIAPVTVRRHISELVRKLGVESRSDLIEHAVSLSVALAAAIEPAPG